MGWRWIPPGGCSSPTAPTIGCRYSTTEVRSVTLDQWVPSHKDNIGNLVINAFILIGILLGFSIVSGVAFGAWRAFRRRGNLGEEADALTSLHLGR